MAKPKKKLQLVEVRESQVEALHAVRSGNVVSLNSHNLRSEVKSETEGTSLELQQLLQSFQSNLLSLISHEVRTPLMGIINALTLLENEASNQSRSKNNSQKKSQLKNFQPRKIQSEDLEKSDVLAMARRNAERLQRTLASLLDLAELDSGVFKIRIREIHWSKIVETRVRQKQNLFRDQQLEIKKNNFTTSKMGNPNYDSPVFGDPQKLSRAIDLLLEMVSLRAKSKSILNLSVGSSEIQLEFQLQPGTEYLWDEAWEESQNLRPRIAFTGLFQSEEGFVRRSIEGLGSEFFLLRQIISAHRGSLTQEREVIAKGLDKTSVPQEWVKLVFALPQLSHREGLEAVLSSRAFQSSSDLTEFALALLVVPGGAKPKELMGIARQSLYRSTDSIYFLDPVGKQEALVAPNGFLAILLDDCKPDDVGPMLRRIQARIQELSIQSNDVEIHHKGIVGAVTAFPSETQDPSELLSLTLRKLP